MKTKVLVITIVALLLIGGIAGAYLLLKDNDAGVIKTTKPDEGINIEEKKEYSDIGKNLFSKYLESQNDLVDYKINSCDMVYYYDNEFICSVNYDVKVEGKAENSAWTAGNGTPEGSWVKNKEVYLKFIKDGNEYVYDKKTGQMTEWNPESYNENSKIEEKNPKKEISLSNQDKININNKLNQPNQKTFAQGLYWIPNNTEENFNSSEAKMLFLSNMVATYGNIVTDTATNKSYYKLSSLQEKSREYFGEELNISNMSLEYYKESKYSDFVYVKSGERKMKVLNPVFKATKIIYNEDTKIYTLFIDILSSDGIDPDEDDSYLANNNLNYDKSLVVATGEIKYKKSANEQNNYLVSFKYIEK